MGQRSEQRGQHAQPPGVWCIGQKETHWGWDRKMGKGQGEGQEAESEEARSRPHANHLVLTMGRGVPRSHIGGAAKPGFNPRSVLPVSASAGLSSCKKIDL